MGTSSVNSQQELYLALRRAVRSCQLYPEGSRARAESVERLAQLLALRLEEARDGVSMAFLDEGAYVDGAFIDPEAEEDSRPVSLQLFELGIRELRFLAGIEAAELRRLIELLTRAVQGMLNPVDEDLAIVLWESDLPHVGYLLYENERDGFEGDDVDPVAIDPFAGDVPLNDYVDADIPIGGEQPASWVTQLTEAERLKLLGQYRREIEEEIPYKYGRLLLEILRVEGEASEVARTQRAVLEYLDALLETERFAVLRLLQQAIDPGDAATDEAREALEAASAWFGEPDLCLRAAQLRQAHPDDLAAAGAFLETVPPGVVPELLALLQDERASAPPAILQAIRAQVRKDREIFRRCLRDPRPAVRRVALEEAGPLEGADTRLVRESTTDPDPGLRARAVRALAQARGDEAGAALSQAVEDPESEVRIAAIHALGLRGGSQSLEMLLRIIVAKDFLQRPPKEKRALFHAAAQASPRDVLPVLARLAEQRGFWPSRERNERIEAALEAIAEMGEVGRGFAEERWGRRRADLLRRLDAYGSRNRLAREQAKRAVADGSSPARDLADEPGAPDARSAPVIGGAADEAGGQSPEREVA